jgi:hypothetical protein
VNKLPNHTALKEWASVISAIEAGDQILLIRKGGIADPRFGLEADRFYLLPTYLHQEEKQFKPEARCHLEATRIEGGEPARAAISSWCEVAATFSVRELGPLLRLEPFVIFTASTIEERFRFRAEQAVHVIAVRAWTLPAPVEIAVQPAYKGCRSWISLDEEIDIAGSRQVLESGELERRIALIGSVLGCRPALPVA